jgi:hypothetical protein
MVFVFLFPKKISEKIKSPKATDHDLNKLQTPP